MKDVQVLNANIIEISQTAIDTTSKEVVMLIHKLNSPNANGLDFIKEYTEVAMKTLVDKPVVCKYYADKDDLGGHEHVIDPKTGKIIELNTIPIGTITDVWIDKINDEDETEALFARATIWSYKYPKIMGAIERNFNEGVCTSSVEVEIYEYNEGASPEYRYGINYTYLANTLLGQSISPADSDAGVLNIYDKEIAEAIKEDLQNNKEVNLLKEKFNKGFEINFHGELEANSLKLNDVSSIIYNKLNPVDAKTGDREYKYWIRDVYTDYVIVEDWNNSKVLYKIPYSIVNDDVVLSEQSEWQKGYLGFIPEGTELSQKETEINELQKQLNKMKEDLSTMEENKTQEVSELQKKIEELETKVQELNSTIVTQQEDKKVLEDKIQELNSEIETLKPYKEQVETAQKEAAMKELNEKFSKLLTEETFKSEEVQNAIQELNEVKLNEIVVNEIAKQKQVEVNEKKTDDVTTFAKQPEDLIPEDITSKYGLSI